MKKFFVVGLVFLLVLTTTSIVLGQNSDEAVPEIGKVVEIIDGDTIDVQLDTGSGPEVQRVRYIGINTPERGEDCADDATAANSALVGGKTVYLQRDQSEVDEFERLLRYVYVDGTFVNAQLVADGWAEAVEYPPDTAFADWFGFLESEAVEAALGCHPTGIFETVTAETESVIQGVTVSVSSNVNLRGGPGTNYPVVGQLQVGDAVSADSRNGEWLHVGDGQWIATWVAVVEGDVNTLPTRSAPAVPQQQAQQASGQTTSQQPVQATVTLVPAQPAQQEPPAQPVEQVPQSTQPPAPAYTCDCSKTCGAMSSCEEAYFQLSCGCGQRDGDGDGVPCEDICSGG